MFGVPIKNLALFALVYIFAAAILGTIDFLLRAQFGFSAESSGAWIGSFGAACIVAGHSFAKASNWQWQREERRRLAMAYAATSFLLSLVFVAIYAIFNPMLGELFTSFWILFIVFFACLFSTLISYAFARFVLGRLVPKMNRQPQ